MWIFLNNSFISVVEDRGNDSRLLVRARVAGDIEKLFPNAETFTDDIADYRHRAFIDREVVAERIAESINNINYDNFKNSIGRDSVERHMAYSNVWQDMYRLQYDA